MDPLTGAAIAKLAFDEFIKSAAGEAAKKAVGAGIDRLRSAIKERFQSKNTKAETAIATIESSDSSTEAKTKALDKLAVYLDDEMDDAPFAETLQQLAQQVNVTQVKGNVVMQQENRDNAKGYQIYAERIDRIGDDYGK